MSDLPPPPPSYGAPQFNAPTGRDYAGWWSRFGAVILDGLIIGIPGNIVDAILGTGGLITFVAGVAYSVYFIGSTGQTLGKKALNVQVIRDGSPAPIGYGLATGRYFAGWLSAIPLLLGYLWPIWDSKNQTFHDKICSTVVVRT